MTRKLVVAITGASGAIYARALVDALTALPAPERPELACVVSSTAPEVWSHELGANVREWLENKHIRCFEGRDYSAPFASGSARWDAMVVVPCSMSTLAKIAHGLSDDLLSRAADVMLKERRKLVLVARETPLSRVHLQNMLAVTDAGALVLPATPSFYGRPDTVEAVVESVVARVLDQLGFATQRGPRWGEPTSVRGTT
ncbi:MAG: UbiX family flavin prenyltransferase [Polyangiales bacterium]